METQISTSTQVIELAFVEGQAVTLLAGAQVGGLTTRCAQPGKVVHIQYSDEHGVIYVVAFGKLQRYAYVSADGLAAVEEPKPLLDAFDGDVDAGDLLPVALDDAAEFIGKGDTVRWTCAACAEAREGVIVQTRTNLDYALVAFEYGALRWLHVDELTLLLKAAAK